MLNRFASALAAIALLAGAFVAQPAKALDLSLDGNLRGQCGTATASTGAATLNNKCGVITSESLTTLTNSEYTLTLTNSVISSPDIVLVSVENGSSTQGEAVARQVTPGAGSVVIKVLNSNLAVSAPFNGTIKVRYFVIKN